MGLWHIPVGNDGGGLVVKNRNELPAPAGGQARAAIGEGAERHGPVLPVSAPAAASPENLDQGVPRRERRSGAIARSRAAGNEDRCRAVGAEGGRKGRGGLIGNDKTSS